MRFLDRLFILSLVAGIAMCPAPAQNQPSKTEPPRQDSPAILEEIGRLEKVADGDDLTLAMSAAHRLGAHYLVEGNAEKAEFWKAKYFSLLTARAEQGDLNAIKFLAQYYMTGSDFCKQDLTQSRKWWEKAAEQGDPMSQYQAAVFYMGGIGGEKDEKKAAHWFSKSRELMQTKAEENDSKAAFWVAQIYFHGLGTPVDYQKAFHYFEKSANLGNIQAQIILAFMYREGKGCEANEQAALKWFQKAADQNDVGAIMEIALAYKEGKGVEKNPAEAIKWLQKGAALKDHYALRTLAVMTEDGEGTAKDEAKALEYYKEAANLGDVYSLLQAAKKLQATDSEQAYQLLRKGSYEYKSPAATYELAMVEEKRGDSAMAAKLLEESAKDGYTTAMLELGFKHLIPFSGASWNPRISVYWWAIAAERGNEAAKLYNNWLVYGGLTFLVLLVVALTLWFNVLIKKKLARQESAEAKPAKEITE